METIVEQILKWAVTFVCGGIASASVTYFCMRRKKDRAIERGVQCLLRSEIVSIHEKYSEKGWCPVHVKESIKREYAAYSQLGGNDVAKELYHQLLELPIMETHEK